MYPRTTRAEGVCSHNVPTEKQRGLMMNGGNPHQNSLAEDVIKILSTSDDTPRDHPQSDHYWSLYIPQF